MKLDDSQGAMIDFRNVGFKGKRHHLVLRTGKAVRL